MQSSYLVNLALRLGDVKLHHGVFYTQDGPIANGDDVTIVENYLINKHGSTTGQANHQDILLIVTMKTIIARARARALSIGEAFNLVDEAFAQYKLSNSLSTQVNEADQVAADIGYMQGLLDL